jgi:hypothetical protein
MGTLSHTNRCTQAHNSNNIGSNTHSYTCVNNHTDIYTHSKTHTCKVSKSDMHTDTHNQKTLSSKVGHTGTNMHTHVPTHAHMKA